MAEKRMFSKTIVDSDVFLEMPLSAQALYFHLSMRADDDGFLNNARKIQKIINASEDDLKLLILKRFVIAFDDGVIVIKHWRMNNYLRNDRYKPTVYQEELAMLNIKQNGAYTLKDSTEQNLGIPLGNHCVTQNSIDKNSIDKNSIDNINSTTKVVPRKSFIPPTVDEVREYLISVGSKIDAESFVAFYESKGWMIGKNKMKNWKSAIVTWEKRNGLKRDVQVKTLKPVEEEKEMTDEEWSRMVEESDW